MDSNAYLQRLHLSGQILSDDLQPTLSTLQTLHYAHMLAVPFENLSIHAHQPIILQEEALFHKIVHQHRGGFCYELNGLFAWLLRQMGFQVSLLSACVARSTGDFNPEFDHLTLLIYLDRDPIPWLADVGFGESFRLPLQLLPEHEQKENDHRYRLHREFNQSGIDHWFLQQWNDERWQSHYRFTLQPHTLSDFNARCYFQQTSPESHFTRQRLCSLATSEGRITLSDWRMLTTIKGQTEERLLSSEEEYRAVLAEQFKIVV